MDASPYQKLAKDFMDLWQKQLSSVMSDKQFIQAMLEMFKTMQNPAYAPKTAASNASDAADAEHGLLAELAFRLGQCEKRLDALERAKSAAKRSGGKSGKARSKKPRR